MFPYRFGLYLEGFLGLFCRVGRGARGWWRLHKEKYSYIPGLIRENKAHFFDNFKRDFLLNFSFSVSWNNKRVRCPTALGILLNVLHNDVWLTHYLKPLSSIKTRTQIYFIPAGYGESLQVNCVFHKLFTFKVYWNNFKEIQKYPNLLNYIHLESKNILLFFCKGLRYCI